MHFRATNRTSPEYHRHNWKYPLNREKTHLPRIYDLGGRPALIAATSHFQGG